MVGRARSLLNFDRAAHLRGDIDALERMLSARDSLLLPMWRDHNLVRHGTEPALCTILAEHAQHWIDRAAELCFVGTIDDRAAFTLDLSNLDDPLEGTRLVAEASFQALLTVGGQLNSTEANLAAFCRAIFHWHRQHRFCGACGSETRPREGGHSRHCSNTECGNKLFPRTDPAIIVLVTHGDRCLLGHQRGWPTGMYSTLAGFVEPGESLEEAVAREVLEEAGVRVNGVRYWKSQPWPFPSSVMLAFHAEAADTSIMVDGIEIEHAAWFSREDLEQPPIANFFTPPAYSVAGQLIEDWRQRRTKEPG